MIRIISIVALLSLAGCATPEFPGGSVDEQRWFDERVADGADAPVAIPDKSPTLTASEIDRAASELLEARDALTEEDRASQSPAADTEAFAEEARDRATRPDPID